MKLPHDLAAAVWATARSTKDVNGEPQRRCLAKGSRNRKLIAEKTINGVEYSYHATKGWRARRLEAAGSDQARVAA